MYNANKSMSAMQGGKLVKHKLRFRVTDLQPIMKSVFYLAYEIPYFLFTKCIFSLHGMAQILRTNGIKYIKCTPTHEYHTFLNQVQSIHCN